MALFKLEFDITYADGSKKHASTRPSTDVAFERRFGVTVASMFASIPPELASDVAGPLDDARKSAAMRWISTAFTTEQTSFLAFHAARGGDDFDVWLDGVDEIDWNFAGRVDPTQATAPAT